jgi:hypothetical protein
MWTPPSPQSGYGPRLLEEEVVVEMMRAFNQRSQEASQPAVATAWLSVAATIWAGLLFSYSFAYLVTLQGSTVSRAEATSTWSVRCNKSNQIKSHTRLVSCRARPNQEELVGPLAVLIRR